jgi:hypothetical protein
MLADQQITEYFQTKNLSPDEMEYIQEVRSSETSHMAGVMLSRLFHLIKLGLLSLQKAKA